MDRIGALTRELRSVRRALREQALDHRFSELVDQTLGRRLNLLLVAVSILVPTYIVGQVQPEVNQERLLGSVSFVGFIWVTFGILPCYLLREFLTDNPALCRDFMARHVTVKAGDFVATLLVSLERTKAGAKTARAMRVAEAIFSSGRKYWLVLVIAPVFAVVFGSALVGMAVSHLVGIAGRTPAAILGLGFFVGSVCILYWFLTRMLRKALIVPHPARAGSAHVASERR